LTPLVIINVTSVARHLLPQSIINKVLAEIGSYLADHSKSKIDAVLPPHQIAWVRSAWKTSTMICLYYLQQLANGLDALWAAGTCLIGMPWISSITVIGTWTNPVLWVQQAS
jgi:hypothetical protein